QPCDFLLHSAEFFAEQTKVAATVMRQAARDDGLGEIFARGDADALVVEERALAALGEKQLVGGGIKHEARDQRAVTLEPDRDRELRNAVQEVGRAVERIDDPGMRLVGALDLAAFLAEERVTRARGQQFFLQRIFRALVGERNEIRRALERDLQLLDFAE